MNNFANCGLFWVTNSVSSVIMGAVNRQQQEQNMMQNLEFQEELEQIKNKIQDEIQAEQIVFKRYLRDIARKNRQEQVARILEQQMKTIELQSFIEKYWPLAPQLPQIILNEIEQSRCSQTMLPLNVVLLREPLAFEKTNRKSLAGKEEVKNIEIYKEIEYQLDLQFQLLGDVKLRRDCCNVGYISGNANLMNIHFLMGALPTIVISPKYNGEGKIIFSVAVWDAQSTRPHIRQLFALDHKPLLLWDDYNLLNEAIEKLKTAISIITITNRDSYMLANYGKKPMLNKILTETQKHIIMTEEPMREFVKTENENLVKAFDVKNVPNLLDVYSEYDINEMRDFAQNMSLMIEN